MDARQRDVLVAVIREYVDSTEPVGSRVLARRHFPNLSAATLRNVMADLEDMGYLVQPHTSAGRVPTDKAYRFYVESFPPPQSSKLGRAGDTLPQRRSGIDGWPTSPVRPTRAPASPGPPRSGRPSRDTDWSSIHASTSKPTRTRSRPGCGPGDSSSPPVRRSRPS